MAAKCRGSGLLATAGRSALPRARWSRWSRWLQNRCYLFALAAFLLMAGCVSEPGSRVRDATDAESSSGIELAPPGNRPQFRFAGLDGREVSSEVVVGRTSVVAFLATFDVASQAQARFLSGIELNHRPRANCFAVVIEVPENEMLVASFVETLRLKYPVAHVTAEALARTRLEVSTVPTVLVFDSGGNVVWRSKGMATEDEIAEVLRAAQ